MRSADAPASPSSNASIASPVESSAGTAVNSGGARPSREIWPVVQLKVIVLVKVTVPLKFGPV